MDPRPPARRPARGFTLIEVMLVVVIIGIISSLAIPRIMLSAARARKTEAVGMVEKMRRHFIPLWRNTGHYPANLVALGNSAWNPIDTPAKMGTPMAWDTTSSGWTDYTFPPDGALRLRYQWQIPDDQTLILMVKGNLPGLDTTYTYLETYHGDTLDPDLSLENPDL